MSVWGKIVGGTAGIVIGGPIGALLGVAGGRADDSSLTVGDDGQPQATQQIAFTIGVIALGAKLARVDGPVTRREIDAFRSFFHVPPEEVENVGRFFDIAKRDVHGFELYARQVADLFPDDPHVLEQVLVGLCLIAGADGAASAPEIAPRPARKRRPSLRPSAASSPSRGAAGRPGVALAAARAGSDRGCACRPRS